MWNMFRNYKILPHNQKSIGAGRIVTPANYTRTIRDDCSESAWEMKLFCLQKTDIESAISLLRHQCFLGLIELTLYSL